MPNTVSTRYAAPQILNVAVHFPFHAFVTAIQVKLNQFRPRKGMTRLLGECAQQRELYRTSDHTAVIDYQSSLGPLLTLCPDSDARLRAGKCIIA
jgi:hypothetical protein